MDPHPARPARHGRDAQVGLGHAGRVERRRLVLDPHDELLVLQRDPDLEPAGPAAIAVDDHVRRGLVDGLDEVVEAFDRRVDGFGLFANETPDLGQATQVGIDAEMVGHPGYASPGGSRVAAARS